MGLKIGILGLAGAGKDTFAEMLLAELNQLVTQDSSGATFSLDRYAAPLKLLTCRIFGMTMEQVEDRVLKEATRKFNQDIAINEVFRTLHYVLNFDDEQLDRASELFFDNFEHTRVISPREFQQRFGTEVVRKIKRTAWTDRLTKDSRNLIIPDVRFENEILCDVNILIQRFENIDRPKHESEHLAWDLQFTGKSLDCPLMVINNRHPITKDMLREQAVSTAQYLHGKLLNLGA